VLGRGPSSRETRSSRADRIKEGKKRLCCVTTRRRNLWVLNSLGRGLGLLAARSLCLGVLSFGKGVLAMFGLSPSPLPAVDFPQAFRILTVALVPRPRPVLAPTPFVQAGPRARSAPSGQTAAFYFNVRGAHGSSNSPGKSSGRMLSHSPRALSKRDQDTYLPV
jgi:hypothetical protein